MTWANLVRKWVGYENQEVQLSTNNSQEEINDQWLMVDISKNEDQVVDIITEPLPTEEQLARRKLWKRRLEKASKSTSSPTLPPRARVLKKPKQTVVSKKQSSSNSKRSKRSRRVEKQQPEEIPTSDQATTTTTSVNDELIAQSAAQDSITQNSRKQQHRVLPHIYRGYVNNHCRLSNFTKSTSQIQHNRCIQQPMKKN
jgi:hypothetical protein